MIDFAEARQMMVDGQIRTNDVTDLRVIKAFLDVPREIFIPAERRDLAYLDRDVPVDARGARCLIKPMVLAKLIQAADIGAEDRVLVVGCATGYSAAIVSQLAGHVIALEADPALARAAAENFARLGCANVGSVAGPLEAGWAAEGPYDVILVDGAVEVVPEALFTQLKPNGRLVCVLRQGLPGEATIYRMSGEKIGAHTLFSATVPVLPGFVRPAEFVF